MKVVTTQIIYVPIGSVGPNPDNPRTLRDERFAALKKSIEDFPEMLEKRPLVVITGKEGGYIVLGGNMRLKALKDLKYKEVPVMLADEWPPERRREFVIKDNVGFGDWDYEALKAGWDAGDLVDWGMEMPVNEEVRALGDPEAVPEVPTVPVSALEDIWLLGNHRIMCGDSTRADMVGRLLGEAKPHLMVTDPPYGVQYDPAFRDGVVGEDGVVRGAIGIGARARGKVLNDDRCDWREAWALFPGMVAYVWHAGIKAADVQSSLEACGFAIRSQIIWNKASLVPGRGNYHWKHEPCWYAVRAGGTAHWNGSRKESTVWDMDRHRKSETGHGTQKPVECMSRPIANNSKPGESVYEPFSGSGTTIIAAEQLGRRCYAMELNPPYVDVAVLRWQEFTGQKAIHEATGKTFEEIAAERVEAVAVQP
jgi:DNA modification methylase